MNTETKIAQMARGEGVELSIFFYHWSNWSIRVEGKHDGSAFQVKGEGVSLQDAVDDAYPRWLRITNALPEFLGALPAPDDEIPY